MIHGDAVKERLHIGKARDCHAGLADLAFRPRVIGIVSHQRWEIERRGQSRLAVREEELESLVRIAGAAESGELPHGPQPATISGRMNASCIRIRAGHAEVRCCLRWHVERRVQWLDFARRVHEANLAELTLGVPATPLGDFAAQSFQLLPRIPVAELLQLISRGRHRASFSVCVRRFALRSSNSSATANGLVLPFSRSASRASSQRFVASSLHKRRLT